MNNPIITVAVISYNPVWEKLRNTLKSIIWQRGVYFEVIIADDGSENDCFDKIEQYLKEQNFSSYKLVKNQKNQGIIKNVLSALKETHGKYVKLISPGDFLYDGNSLCKFVDFAEKKPAAVYFSNLYYFSKYESGNIKVFDNKKNPRDLRPYLKNDMKKIKRNYLVYLDLICGASIMYNTQKLNIYLTEISAIATWAEDMVVLYMVANNEKLCYMNVFGGVWYEYGCGISTAKKSVWGNRIYSDLKNILLLLVSKKLYPNWLYKAYSSGNRFKRCFLKLLHIPYMPLVSYFIKHKVHGYENVLYDIKQLEKILA